MVLSVTVKDATMETRLTETDARLSVCPRQGSTAKAHLGIRKRVYVVPPLSPVPAALETEHANERARIKPQSVYVTLAVSGIHAETSEAETESWITMNNATTEILLVEMAVAAQA